MISKNPYEKILFPNDARLILVPMDGVNSVASSVMVGGEPLRRGSGARDFTFSRAYGLQGDK